MNIVQPCLNSRTQEGLRNSVLALPVCLAILVWKVFPYLAAREKEKTERMKLETDRSKLVTCDPRGKRE